MNDKEIKAIEYFKDDISYLEEELKRPNFEGRYITIRSAELEKLKVLLNLIEKQNKIIETNKENWLLVQNEVLGYAQGYEDGKQHKQTATAMVVENRKYQIIGEEIKKYKAIIENQKAEIEDKDREIIRLGRKANEYKKAINCKDCDCCICEAHINTLELRAEIENKDIALRECERNLIEERQNRIKEDKIINLMAEELKQLREASLEDCFIPRSYRDIDDCLKTTCEECIKQYFEKKAEEEK